MKEKVFAIVIESPTDLQREQVQAAVKQHAELWWHGLADLWLVVGKTAKEWRDLLKPIFPISHGGKVLVLAADGPWAARGNFSESETQWLHKNFETVPPETIQMQLPKAD